MCCPSPCLSSLGVTPVHLGSAMQPGRWQSTSDPASRQQHFARVSLHTCALRVMGCCYTLFCLTWALHHVCRSRCAGCKLEVIAFVCLPGAEVTEQHLLLENNSPKEMGQPDLTHIRVFPCFIDPNDPRKQTLCHRPCLLTPQLSLPPGSLWISLSE